MKIPHSHPLEMVEAAIEVADLAWTALEKHKKHSHPPSPPLPPDSPPSDSSSRDALALEACLMLERLLAEERLENRRLDAALTECRRSLREAKLPMGPSDCPSDLYRQLKDKVESPDYVEKLKALHQSDANTSSIFLTNGDGLPRTIKVESEDTNSWLMVPSDSLKQNERKGDAFPNDDEDDYVVLSQDDVVEGVVAFVAKLILANPRAKKMSPCEIQQVISKSFTKLERSGKIQRLWSIGRFVYTSATWTTALIGLYKNPFIMKALLKGLTFSGKLALKLLI